MATGNITLSPPGTARFYIGETGQVVAFTATVAMNPPDTIPEGAIIVFGGSGWAPTPDNNNIKAGDIPNGVFIEITSADRTQGRAVVYGAITGLTAPTLEISRIIDFPNAPPLPAALSYPMPSSVALAVSRTAISPSYYIPVAPDNTQGPLSNGGKYASMLSVEVTEKSSGVPVPNYILDWKEHFDTGIALLTERLRVFLHPSDTPPLRKGDFECLGNAVRTQTGSDGVARLYIVSTRSAVASRLDMVPSSYGAPYAATRLVVADLAREDIADAAFPYYLKDGGLDLDTVQASTLPIRIPVYQNAHPTDYIYLILRNPAVGIQLEDQFSWRDRTSLFWNSEVMKSDVVADGVTRNTLQYLVTTIHGDVYTSSKGIGFTATGSDAAWPPTEGTLEPPTVPGTNSLITYSMLTDGYLYVNVPLPYNSSVPAQQDDQINLYGFIAGFPYGGAKIFSSIKAIGNVNAVDISNGFLQIPFFAAPFIGFGQSNADGSGSTVSFVYTVNTSLTLPLPHPGQLSNVALYELSTVPRDDEPLARKSTPTHFNQES